MTHLGPINSLICSLFFTCTSLAQAACPTAGDLATGVKLIRDTPFFGSVFTRNGTVVAEQRLRATNGDLSPAKSLYPHPLIIGRRESDRGVLELRYVEDTNALNTLPRIKVWRSKTLLISDEAQVDQGVSEITFLQSGAITVGQCTYDVWHVNTRLMLGNRAPIVFEKAYAPDLDLVLRSTKMTADNQPISVVEFDQITQR